MNDHRPVLSLAFRIATIAILAAVTTVFTLFVRVPSPRAGYFNLGDVAIAFAAFTFGPVSALLAGVSARPRGPRGRLRPVGAHQLRARPPGARDRPDRPPEARATFPVAIAAGILGIAVMVVGYGAEGSHQGDRPGPDRGPRNLVQSAAGVILGMPLSLAVPRAYPPVRNWTW